ncbi:MAG: ABC transporter substrate-binding protein [Candidatus Methanosuratincola petrocarbonis]
MPHVRVLLALMMILLVMIPPAWCTFTVPGDLDGDRKVSIEELQRAEDLAKERKISPEQLEEIRHIHMKYPRTIVDACNRTVTIYRPVERIIAFGGYDAELISLVGDGDKIVGVADWFKDNDFRRICLPSIAAKPTAGNAKEPDLEKILELDPDMIICWHYYPEKLEKNLPENITVVALDLFDPRTYLEEAKKLAYLLEREEELDDFLTNYYSKYMNLIRERTRNLSDEERPRVYWERLKPYESFGSQSYITALIELCGGQNIFAEDDFDIDTVDAEAVIKENPAIIIRDASSKGPETGYSVDDPAKAKELRESVTNRAELASTDAIKNNKVYVINMKLHLGIHGPIGAAYVAKILQPDLFTDLNPKNIHKELLNDYLNVSFDLEDHGIFVYPPMEGDV